MLCQLKALANPAYVSFNGFLQPIGSLFKGILGTTNCLDSFPSVLSQHVCTFVQRQKNELSPPKPPARNVLWLLLFSIQKCYTRSFLHESLEQAFCRTAMEEEEIIQSSNIILKMCIKQCPFVAIRKPSRAVSYFIV